MSVEVENDLIKFSYGEAHACVAKKGCTLVSFVVDGDEYLYLSEAANLSSKSPTPVRGGMPLIFPAFGNSYLESLKTVQQHGFVRNMAWDFVIAEVLTECTVARFRLSHRQCEKEQQYKNWCEFYGQPIKFELTMVFELFPDCITVNTGLVNENVSELEFQFLYHTYFRVPCVRDMYITGLKGAKYLDRLQTRYGLDGSPMLKVEEQTDKLYELGENNREIDILSGNYNVRLTASDNLKDLVVWNPWEENAAKMKDFEPKSSYRNMCCVEFGTIGGTTVTQGQRWQCQHTITII
ncbi:hypothetical protein KL937_003161 [Ogataea polymorpha]|nr:hypothetical protein KL937_003161 [Ogataea polymorpha]KAG7935008.1 hypothetical protein KL904_003340 [Ogataea polymorpha]